MHRDRRGRLVFSNGYERMAHFTMEHHLGRAQGDIAQEFGLSHQRVSQIVKAGYARSGRRPSDPPSSVALGLRRFAAPAVPDPGTPEHFCLYEIHQPAPI